MGALVGLVVVLGALLVLMQLDKPSSPTGSVIAPAEEVTDMCNVYASVIENDDTFTLTRTYVNRGMGTCDFYVETDPEYHYLCKSLIMRYDNDKVLTCIPDVGPMCETLCDRVNK